MSDITPKNYNGLMEAYASVYNKPEQTTQEQLEEEICFEDLEVDNDLLVDIIAERLIAEEYANTEDEALNMIPHMSDAWLDNVVGNFVLQESFIDAVNSLLEEGHDLSLYTVDELYEDYIGHFNNHLNENYNMNLYEAVPLVAAPLLANPATAAAMAGLGAGAVYAGKKALDNIRKLRSGTDAASQRWLETGSYASKKESPKAKRDSAEQRRQKAAERLLQRQKAKQQQPAPTEPAKSQQSSGSTSGTPQGQPGGGDKKPEWQKKFMDALKGEKKPPSPMMQQVKQQVKQKAAEVGGTAARKIDKGALGLGIGGLVDQGLLGGVGGKLTRDVTRFTRGIGPGYEQLKRELKGEPAPAPKPTRKSQALPGFE